MPNTQEKTKWTTSSQLPELSEEEMFFHLLQKPNDELEKIYEELEERRAQMKMVHKETLLERKRDKIEIIRLEKAVREQAIDRLIHEELVKRLSSTLVEIQKIYNDLVDPLNISRKKLDKIKGSHKTAANLYNDRKIKADEFEEELQKKVAEIDDKIMQAQSTIKEMQQMEDLDNKTLQEKTEALHQTREVRKSLEVQVQALDMEGLNKKLQEVQQGNETKIKQLEELQIEISDAAEHGRYLSDQKVQLDKNLATMQNDIAEESMSNLIAEQRIENDKKIIEKILTTKIKRREQRVESANINLATELQIGLEQKKLDNELISELEVKKQETHEQIEKLKTVIKESDGIKTELAKQLESLNFDDTSLQQQLNEIKAQIQDVKNKEQEISSEMVEAGAAFNKQIKKEIRLQTLYGVFDDERYSSKSSDEVESEISSSLSNINPVEKTNYDMTFDTSTEYD